MGEPGAHDAIAAREGQPPDEAYVLLVEVDVQGVETQRGGVFGAIVAPEGGLEGVAGKLAVKVRCLGHDPAERERFVARQPGGDDLVGRGALEESVVEVVRVVGQVAVRNGGVETVEPGVVIGAGVVGARRPEGSDGAEAPSSCHGGSQEKLFGNSCRNFSITRSSSGVAGMGNGCDGRRASGVCISG